MGKWIDVTYKNEGYCISIPLAQFKNHKKYHGYYVFCHYKHAKCQDKYSLSMWLKHSSMDSKYKIEFEKIDTQYISGNTKTIRENICRIVDQMMKNGLFDMHIKQFEQNMECFDKGYEVLHEKEVSV